jgi:uncharacterized delta-60 repeat protein
MSRFAIARYLPDGQLDAEFGEGGITVVDWQPEADQTAVSSFDIQVQADNSVLVAGGWGRSVGIALVGADGQVVNRPGMGEVKSIGTFMPDQSFARVRKVLIAQRVALADGGFGGQVTAATDAGPGGAPKGSGSSRLKIVRARVSSMLARMRALVRPGHRGGVTQSATPGGPAVLAVGDAGENPAPRFAAFARFRTDGTLDTAFSGDGQLMRGLGEDDIEVHTATYRRRDGKGLALARGDVNGLPMVRGVRVHQDGSSDQAFGLLADIWTSTDDGAWTLTPVDAASAGADTVVAAETFKRGVTGAAGVFKVSSSGAQVQGFGVDGGVGFIPHPDGISKVRAVSIDARSRIAVAGTLRGSFGVERFLPNGTVDTGFGQGGTVSVPFAGMTSAANTVFLESVTSERLIVAGRADGHFALVRLAENGETDLSFGAGGTVRTVVGQFGSEIEEVAVDGERRIVAVGRVAVSRPID